MVLSSSFKKAGSPDLIPPPNIYIHLCTLYTGVLARVRFHFCGECGVHQTGVPLDPIAFRCVNSTGVFHITAHICDTITAECSHALAYAQLVHSRWELRVGCSASLCRALVTWRGGFFLTEGE